MNHAACLMCMPYVPDAKCMLSPHSALILLVDTRFGNSAAGCLIKSFNSNLRFIKRLRSIVLIFPKPWTSPSEFLKKTVISKLEPFQCFLPRPKNKGYSSEYNSAFFKFCEIVRYTMIVYPSAILTLTIDVIVPTGQRHKVVVNFSEDTHIRGDMPITPMIL